MGNQLVINFRYHVVSLAAALLALAAGVVLGAGFLDTTDNASDDADRAAADPAVESFESGFAGRVEPALLTDQLADQTVLILTTPGAGAEDISGITGAIEQAGGEVVGQGELTSKLLDPAGRQFAEGVAQQVGEDVEGIDAEGDSYQRIGAALARALVSDEAADVDDDAMTLRAAFVEGDLLTLEGEPSARATLTVVVTGPRSSTSEDQGVSLAGITAALDTASSGVLVAGPVSASRPGGFIAALRGDDLAGTVSTVDVSDSPSGRIVAALALGQEASGDAGAWGTSRSADGAVPSDDS